MLEAASRLLLGSVDQWPSGAEQDEGAMLPPIDSSQLRALRTRSRAICTLICGKSAERRRMAALAATSLMLHNCIAAGSRENRSDRWGRSESFLTGRRSDACNSVHRKLLERSRYK